MKNRQRWQRIFPWVLILLAMVFNTASFPFVFQDRYETLIFSIFLKCNLHHWTCVCVCMCLLHNTAYTQDSTAFNTVVPHIQTTSEMPTALNIRCQECLQWSFHKKAFIFRATFWLPRKLKSYSKVLYWKSLPYMRHDKMVFWMQDIQINNFTFMIKENRWHVSDCQKTNAFPFQIYNTAIKIQD